MEAFRVHSGLVVPLDRANVDTDLIIPKQFLKSIKRTGFGPNLFDELRYLDPFDEAAPSATRQPNPEFSLNMPKYAGASILLSRENFGCGSSESMRCGRSSSSGFAVSSRRASLIFSRTMRSKVACYRSS